MTTLIGNLPLISGGPFLAIMAALFAVDAWSTTKALRSKLAKEVNPVMRVIIKALGVDAAMVLTKIAVLAWIVTHPVADAFSQWVTISVYVVVCALNLRGLKKLGLI